MNDFMEKGFLLRELGGVFNYDVDTYRQSWALRKLSIKKKSLGILEKKLRKKAFYNKKIYIKGKKKQRIFILSIFLRKNLRKKA